MLIYTYKYALDNLLTAQQQISEGQQQNILLTILNTITWKNSSSQQNQNTAHQINWKVA